MSTQLSVGSQRLYVVTDDGRAAASAEDSCECVLMREDSLLVCQNCGTAWAMGRNYGYVLSRVDDR